MSSENSVSASYSGTPHKRSGADAGEKLFVPNHYEFNEPEVLQEFIAERPLAQISSAGTAGLRSSATPLIHVGQDAETLEFIGHIARRNPQSQAVLDGEQALAVFVGPDAYVSPRWFKVSPVLIPTWSYVSVQLHGHFEPVTDLEETYNILRATIGHMERPERIGTAIAPWVMENAEPEMVERLGQMIVAFRFKGTKMEGVKRLCQDKDLVDIQNVCESLQVDNQPNAAAVAAMMAPLYRRGG